MSKCNCPKCSDSNELAAEPDARLCAPSDHPRIVQGVLLPFTGARAIAEIGAPSARTSPWIVSQGYWDVASEYESAKFTLRVTIALHKDDFGIPEVAEKLRQEQRRRIGDQIAKGPLGPGSEPGEIESLAETALDLFDFEASALDSILGILSEITIRAYLQAENSFGSKTNSRWDKKGAFRHCYWLCLLCQRFPKVPHDVWKEFGRFFEFVTNGADWKTGPQMGDSWRDVWNNDYGIDKCCGDERDCADCCLDAVESGKLQIAMVRFGHPPELGSPANRPEPGSTPPNPESPPPRRREIPNSFEPTKPDEGGYPHVYDRRTLP